MIDSLCNLQQHFDGTLPTSLNQACLAKQSRLTVSCHVPDSRQTRLSDMIKTPVELVSDKPFLRAI